MDTRVKPEPAAATYRQIEADLRRKVRDAVWPVGFMVPSRRELARQYGVSTLTVERAIHRLIADGILRADDRRGTFVAAADGAAAAAAAAAVVQDTVSAEAFAVPALPPPSPYVLSPRTSSLTVGVLASLYMHHQDHLALNNLWVRQLVESVEHSFSENGEATRFFNRVQNRPEESVEPLPASITSALTAGVDALVLIAFGQSPQEVEEALSVLDADPGKERVPVVCIISGELQRPIPHVFLDNRSGGYQAAEHLLRQGSRDLLVLAPFRASWVADRIEGVRAAARHAGLASEGGVRLYPEAAGDWVNEEDPEVLGYAAARAAFAEGIITPSTGVVAVNDGVAFGLLRAAMECGRVPGRDFLVLGFDDHPDARHRQLTSLRPAMEAMGQEAARLLRQALSGRPDSLQVRLRSRLIPRASTRPVSPLNAPAAGVQPTATAGHS